MGLGTSNVLLVVGNSEREVQSFSAKLNARIADLGREALNLSLAVSNYQENVAGAQAQLEDVATLKADKTTQCGAEDAAYQFKNSELQNQITTCGNAIYLMEDKRE